MPAHHACIPPNADWLFNTNAAQFVSTSTSLFTIYYDHDLGAASKVFSGAYAHTQRFLLLFSSLEHLQRQVIALFASVRIRHQKLYQLKAVILLLALAAHEN